VRQLCCHGSGPAGWHPLAAAQPFEENNGYLVVTVRVMSWVYKDIHSRKIVQPACNVHVNKAIKVYKYSALPYSL